MRRPNKLLSLLRSARIGKSSFILLRSLRCNWIIRFLFFVALLLPSNVSLAGPPFLTDDPVPVDRGHWEINNYVAGSLANGASGHPASTATTAPSRICNFICWCQRPLRKSTA